MIVHLDFETRCDLDLRKVGLTKYVAHPSFRILLTALAEGDGPVQQWEGLPRFMLEWNRNPPDEIHAFNAPFEREALMRYGVNPPIEVWRDTMSHAYARGFSGSLADVGAQLGLPADQQKLASGTRLINKFCEPRTRLSKANQDRYWSSETAPEDWARFKTYNKQDVLAESEVSLLLEAYPMTEEELRLMWWDWGVNRRGLPVDMPLVESAIEVAKNLSKKLEEECLRLTGGISPGQVAELLKWCQEHGYEGHNLQAEDIEDQLRDPLTGIDDEGRRVLEIRLAHSQAATKKFQAIANRQHAGRITHTLQYCGAQRTGRWAGRGLQLQNLKRSPQDADSLAQELVNAPETFAHHHTLEDLGGLVRSAITAPDGYRLVVSDLSAIESRVLGWLTGCRWINDTFAKGRDTYKAFAEMWLGTPYDKVDKATRTLAKPPFLGFGYGIGAKGLLKYAHGMGVPLSEDQCLSAIAAARKICHEVPTFWGQIESAFRFAVHSGKPIDFTATGVQVVMVGRFLTIRLPSGRRLYYDNPQVDEEINQINFLGQNQFTQKWERLPTWGGKLTENLAQAIARDILAFGMLLYTQDGGTIIGHVHDEAIALEREEYADAALKHLNKCLSTEPPWAPGLLLGAEGYIAKRYRKG